MDKESIFLALAYRRLQIVSSLEKLPPTVNAGGEKIAYKVNIEHILEHISLGACRDRIE